MSGQWVDHNGQWMWDYSYTDPNTGYQYSGSEQNPQPGQYDYNGEPLPTWQGQEGQPASATQPGQGSQGGGGGMPPWLNPNSSNPTNPAPNLGSAPPPGAGLTSTQQSAKASLDSFLGQYGLQSLGDYAWNEYLNGVPIEQIMLDIRARPEYQQRFPGMAQLSAAGHAISEQQYLDLERQYISIYRQAGLPSGFYDQPSDFGKLIGSEVSPSELKSRLDLYSQMVYSSDPEVTKQLQSLYGLSTGDILAYTIDPTLALPILQKKYQAAQESAAGVLSGFGALTAAEGERLALLGVSQQQAMSGFAQLGQEKELFSTLPGEAYRNPITREQELGAQFQGNAEDRAAIERIRQQRLGQFQGGGQYAATSKGVVGLEPAQT